MASYGVLEEHTILDPDFSILAFAFCWACGLSWNEAWANVKSLLLDIPMSGAWANVKSLLLDIPMSLIVNRFEEAAKRMGVDAAQCLVIEDSL
jgi:hypothetical protein